jgi:hypothetical protein
MTEAVSPIGSVDRPFKLAIIGGGPSGCSVIVRAVRTGNLEQLCKADDKLMLAGVCIIDQSSSDRFGGGRLQDYAINSNTFANKFASNVVETKIDTLPPESLPAGSCFEKLRESDNLKYLEEVGCKQGSLKVVGSFLHDVGNAVTETISKYSETSQTLTDTKVEAIQRYQRKDGLIGWKLTLSSVNKESSSGNKESFIYAKDVLFATGGRQETPTLANGSHNNKIIGRYF